MIRRTSKFLLEVVGALLAGTALLVGFLAWRLTHEGPIHLRFISPYIERSIAQADKNFKVGVEDTVLAWAGWERALDVRAINLHVRDRQGRDIAILPEVSLTFSARAMLRGLMAPSKVEILAPDIALRRRADGVLMFGSRQLGQDSAEQGDPGVALAELLDDLLEGQNPDNPRGYLNAIAVLDGHVTIADRVAGLTWEATHVNFDMERQEHSGLSGRLSAQLPQFGEPALATATINYDTRAKLITLDSAFQGFDLAALGLVESRLSGLSTTHVTLSGRVATKFNIDGTMGPIDFMVNTAGATLDLPEITKEPLPITVLQVTGRIDRSKDLVSIDKFDADIGGPEINVSGTIDGLFGGKAADGGPPLVNAQIGIAKFPASSMDRYWPNGVAADTRAWLVPNMPAGMVDKMDAVLALRLPGTDATGAATAAKVEKLDGKLATSGLTVSYLAPMPPITDGVATAVFDTKTFTADISAGRVGDVKIEKGHLVITGLDVEDQFIKVGGDVSSTVPAALKLLDHPRLGYASKLGIHPDDSSGDAKANIEFNLPAAKNLTFKDVTVAVTAEIAHVGLKKARFGQDLTDGTLSLQLDKEAMEVKGPVIFAGMPLSITWSEYFTDDAPVAQKFRAVGPASADQRALLGFDFRPWLDGPCACDIGFQRARDGAGRLDLGFDLKEGIIDLPFIKWRKPAGQPGEGALTLQMAGDKPVAMPSFKLSAGDLSAVGSATFAANGAGFAKVDLAKVSFGKTALTDVAFDLTGPAVNVSLGGGQMDVEPWMAERDAPVDPATLDAQELKPQRPYTARGALTEVRLGEGQQLSNVSFELSHDPIWWDVIAFQGTLPGGAPISFAYRPAEAGLHRLAVETEDGGDAFRALGIYDSIRGGKLKITGKVKDEAPHRPLVGRMKMSSFRLLHTPFAVRFLSVASLTGLIDAATGEGFLFNGATAKFVKTRGRIDVSDFRTAGPSIGLTSSGNIDLDQNTVDLKGALVPAYAFNSFLGNIPVIGEWLQGGAGEGMFSATYTINGVMPDPKINVNGWSALAPGFLRNIFSDEGTSGANIDIPDDAEDEPSAPAGSPDKNKKEGGKN